MTDRVGLIYHRTTLPWIFEAAARVECELVLLPRPDEDQANIMLPASVVDVLSYDVLGAPEASIEMLRKYQRKHGLDGLLTMYDPAVPFTASAAARLGLPGLDPSVAAATVDKRAVRTALSVIGANTPSHVAVSDPYSPPTTAGLRFPVVVKPASGYSSLGVTRVDRPELLPAELPRVARLVRDLLSTDALACGLLVEEYIDGPEYAVESFVHSGRTYVLSIGYKGQPMGPYFEESVYQAPAQLDSVHRAAIVHQVELANDALGITTGPVHTELRLHADGRPFVFDIGARIGGSGVSDFIVRYSTGVDFADNALRAALGQAPIGLRPDPVTIGYSGAYIVQCGGSGIIAEINGLAELIHDDAVRHVLQFLFPGDEVRPYPEFSGYPAFVCSVHRTAEALALFHQRLDDLVRICYRT